MATTCRSSRCRKGPGLDTVLTHTHLRALARRFSKEASFSAARLKRSSLGNGSAFQFSFEEVPDPWRGFALAHLIHGADASSNAMSRVDLGAQGV